MPTFTARLKCIVPADVKKALGRVLLKEFTAMSYSHQKEWIRALESAKKPETRERRVESLVTAMRKKPVRPAKRAAE